MTKDLDIEDPAGVTGPEIFCMVIALIPVLLLIFLILLALSIPLGAWAFISYLFKRGIQWCR